MWLLIKVLGFYSVLALIIMYGAWRFFGLKGFSGIEDSGSWMAKLFAPRVREISKGAAWYLVLRYSVVFILALAILTYVFRWGSVASAAHPGLPTAADILGAVTAPNPTSDQARLIAEEIESLLQASTLSPDDVRQISDDKAALIKALNDMKSSNTNDPETLAVTTYGLLLCERFSANADAKGTGKKDSWGRIALIAAPWSRENLKNSDDRVRNRGYVFAIRAFGAEAIERRLSVDDGIAAYQDLVQDSQNQDSQNQDAQNQGAQNQKAQNQKAQKSESKRFLSPVDLTLVDGKEFVTGRVDDLRARVWVYGSPVDNNSSKNVADLLVDHGLARTLAQGNWHKKYPAPYIYHRKNASIRTLDKLKKLVAPLADRSSITADYERAQKDAKDPDVEKEFDANTGLDFLVILSPGTRDNGAPGQRTVATRYLKTESSRPSSD